MDLTSKKSVYTYVSIANLHVSLSTFTCIFLVRSGISIVPQSPDLFEGTIRENIDPTGVSQDADIWVALEHVRHSHDYDSIR